MASSGITGGTLLGVVALSDGEQEKVLYGNDLVLIQ